MEEKVQPEVIKTKNIQHALKTYAVENFTPLEECDFKINKIETFIKTSAMDDFTICTQDPNELYGDQDKIINEHINFQQVYTITATPKKLSKLSLHYDIDFGKFATHPKLVIYPDSIIPIKSYQPKEIYALLKREVNKIKLKHKILINLFDEEMLKYLKAFTKHLYAKPFNKKVKIPLFTGIEPTITRESKLVFLYKQKETTNQVIEVEAGETLVKYYKPIFGINGFSSHGNIISAGFADNKDDLHTPIDPESIKIEENDEHKLYISINKGFVNQRNGMLLVDNKIQLNKLSRVHTTLTEEEENNIEVIVSQHDTNKDSIGEGVELTSESIHVHGFIGANSILEAVELQVDGATHQDSIQYAKNARVNRHKGTLRCHNANISLLEGGTVHATKVDVESCLGGTIYAQDVVLGNVKSNLKVYASNSISVRIVSGEDNLFKINYRDVPILMNKLEFIRDDIDDLKYALEEAQRHNQTQVEAIEQKIANFKTEIQNITNSTLNARISIKQPLKGLNTINFTLDSSDEIIYKTDAKTYDPFYLEIDETQNITLHPVGKKFSFEQL